MSSKVLPCCPNATRAIRSLCRIPRLPDGRFTVGGVKSISYSSVPALVRVYCASAALGSHCSNLLSQVATYATNELPMLAGGSVVLTIPCGPR
jgi:hypothetical protein